MKLKCIATLAFTLSTSWLAVAGSVTHASASPGVPGTSVRYQSTGAGSLNIALGVRNHSSRVCYVSGIPDVRPALVGSGDKLDRFVGPDARKLVASGRGSMVTLRPGSTASVEYVSVEARDYTSSQCLASSSDGVAVTYDSAIPKLRLIYDFPTNLVPVEVCTRFPSTRIMGIAMGMRTN